MRIRELIAKIKGITWELDNLPMNKEVTCWADEIEELGKYFTKLSKQFKNYEKGFGA